ncbi:MAG: T9SS type A sorting domain-containing protein [Ignavibacteria bacterium]
MKNILILFLTFVVCILALANVTISNPKPLYKIGSYFEFIYLLENVSDTLRYSAKVTSDTIINNVKYQKLTIFNEPFMGTYNQYYYFDTLTNVLYSKGGYTNGCQDSTYKQMVIGFNWPKGMVFNTCSDSMGGSYFRSIVNDTGTYSNILNSGIPLRAIQRKDTTGSPIYGTRLTVFSEMFGFFSFYQGYGNPFGGGWYKIQLFGAIIDSVRYGHLVLGVEQLSASIPERFFLFQNYPNPFNPITTIEFSLPKATNAKLKIFDILGRERSLLFDEKKSAGTYRYIFNSGAFESGLYFYRLETDYGVQSKRMIVIK